MRRFRLSVAQQFMLVLFAVLTVAQAINLVLLVGERALVRQNNLNQQVLQTVEDILLNPPDLEGVRLPFYLPEVRGLRGAFFYSDNNRAVGIPTGKNKPKLEATLQKQLEANGLSVLGVDVTLLREGPNAKRAGDETLREGQGDRPGARPRPGSAGPRPLEGRPDGRLGPPRPAGEPRFRPQTPPGGAGGFAPGIEELLVSVEVEDGLFFNAMVPHYPRGRLAPRILLATGVLLLLTLLVGGFFIQRIVSPYGKFAESAKRLGRGETPIALSETGPDDVRNAAIAFNRMQDRLTRLIESQRTMLRAVGHDLRTPLTAMRINVENMQSGETKTALINSIGEMTALTEDVLGWAKDLSGNEALAPVNLPSYLHALVETYHRQGDTVAYEESGPIVVKMRRDAMRRALRNLIDNGVRYAGAVTLRAEASDNHVTIFIEDNGPGIPDRDLLRVLEPFVRLETSRNKKTGGTGLGLSIAQYVIQTDGGQLILANRPDGGLQVKVIIPH